MDSPPRMILVVGTPQRAAFADVMLQDIAEGLRALGEDVRLLLMEDEGDVAAVRAEARAAVAAGRAVGQVDINASFNIAPSEAYPVGHRFTLLIDHPFFHLKRLAVCRQPMTVGVVDRTHLPALADCGLDLPVRFLPHGGPAPVEAPPPMTARTIDILFCANLSPLIFEPVFNRELDRLPEAARGVAVETINHVLGGELDIHARLRTACGRLAEPPFTAFDRAVLKQIYALVQGTVVAFRRRDLVAALCRVPDRRVHIVGNIPEVLDTRALAPLPEVRIHGMLPFDRVRGMMADTRLLVNANPTIGGGSHERVWQAMAQGCAVITNDSTFMRDHFADGRDILYLPPADDALIDRLHRWSGDPAALQTMADRARSIYARDHLWARRMETIAAVFDAAFSPAASDAPPDRGAAPA